MAMSRQQRQKRIDARIGIALQFKGGAALEDISDTLKDIHLEMMEIKIHLAAIAKG